MIAPQEKAFQTTLEVLRQQRETQADLVVQLSVQLSAQTDYNALLQQNLVDLQYEHDKLLIDRDYSKLFSQRMKSQLDILHNQLQSILTNMQPSNIVIL